MYFTENGGKEIHPCVVVEIVLKWWSKRTDTENVDMGFIKPLIATIEKVSSVWCNSVRFDERYSRLMTTLDIPRPTALRFITYMVGRHNRHVLKDCISKGDDTPAQLKYLKCSKNMEIYRQSVPALRYNDAVFPPYGDTTYHWYISTYDPVKHVSLITDSKEEILDYIDNAMYFSLD